MPEALSTAPTMDSDKSSDHEDQTPSRLRESVSMVIRQLQPQQPARAQSEEIPESDEGEQEDQVIRQPGADDEEKSVEEENDDNDLYQTPQRRYSVSSVGSHYNPSTTSEGAAPDHHSLKAEPNPQGSFTPIRSLARPRKSGQVSPYSTVPPTPTQAQWLSPRKRSRSSSPHIRPASAGFPSPRPFKRHKGTFNHAYLNLLNEDIIDAASRYVPHNWDDTLAPSQVGLAYWSEAEKTLFFEALARLGRDDTAGIAGRLKTKSALEVADYLALLDSAACQKKDPITPADLPAAVELSQACCAALEEAADAVAIRQERREEAEERKRWAAPTFSTAASTIITTTTNNSTEPPEEFWLITPSNYTSIQTARSPPAKMLPFLTLFRLRSWLQLSSRLFMNSAVEEYNWRAVADEPPSIRATALEDFHALAVSVTRRLVAATVFVAESRVKSIRAWDGRVRKRVWRSDVKAAVMSLGLRRDAREFWARCARRLRLEVVDDDGDSWDEGEPLAYEEVESALGVEGEGGEEGSGESEQSELEEKEMDEDDASMSENGSVELGTCMPYASEHEEGLPEEDEAEKEAVNREMNEILVHSALEYPKSKTARANLRHRIRSERAHEAYADALDAKASYYEEKRLWALLERQPTVELAKPDVPAETPKYTKRTVDDLINGFSRTPGGGSWREKLEAVPSRWEMDYVLSREEKNKAKAATAAESGDEI
ncbi:hypothetical protein VTI74DRAFT_7092 [Chaetomium olivicolor]